VKLRRTRQLRDAAAASSGAPDPASFVRPGPGQPPPASGPSGQLHVARQTPSSAVSHERLRATFAPRFPGNTGPSKVFARKSPPPSQSPASFGDGHPSTHGAASRRRTGTGQGPTSAWLRPAPPHEQFAAPQHRRAGRTKRGQRSSRSTQFHAVPPHQQLAAQQYRFSAQRSTAFRHTAALDNRISPLKLAGRNSSLIRKAGEGTESPITVNRNALRRSPIYRQTGRFPALPPNRPNPRFSSKSAIATPGLDQVAAVAGSD
jgi:hypothetical protein